MSVLLLRNLDWLSEPVPIEFADKAGPDELIRLSGGVPLTVRGGCLDERHEAMAEGDRGRVRRSSEGATRA